MTRFQRQGAQRAYQVKRLALAGLSRILAKPDHDPLGLLQPVAKSDLKIGITRPAACSPRFDRLIAKRAVLIVRLLRIRKMQHS